MIYLTIALAFTVFLTGVTLSQSIVMKTVLSKLIAKQHLTSSETEKIWNKILAGDDPVCVASILVALRMKGETPTEIAGMVKAMVILIYNLKSFNYLKFF